MGIELSIPLLLLTLLQGVGTVLQARIDIKIRKQDILSNRMIIALLLILYNWFRLLEVADNTTLDLCFFVLNCGFVSTLILESQIKNRSRFLIVALANVLLFSVVFLVTFWIDGIGFHERLLILSLVLIIYFVAFTITRHFSGVSSSQTQGSLDTFFASIVFIFIAFGSLLIREYELMGVLTLNVFYLGYVAKDLLLFRYYGGTTRMTPQNTSNQNSIEDVLAPFQLSERQLKVAKLLLENKSVPEIASQLGVSDNAIYQHCHLINKKTGSISTIDFVFRYSKLDAQESEK